MTDISLGQTITDVFTKYTPTSRTKPFPTSYTDYILPILPNFEQIQITLDPKDNAILDGTTLSIYNVATNYLLARITASVSGSATAINKPVSLYTTIYPGITYGIEVYNSTVSAANLAGILPGAYSLSLTDRGQATSIVSASTYKLGLFGENETYTDQVGTVNVAGKYSTLATGSYLLADVALSPSGLFYGIKSSSDTSTADQLWVVDPSLPEGSQVGKGANLKDTSGNNLFKSLNALAFSSNNQLYAIGRNTAGVSEFYQIDVNTKVATLLSTLPAGLSTKFGSFSPNGGDLVYDAGNNRFLVTSNSASNNDLWQIPLANPSGATKIGNIGFYNLAGLSFENGQLTAFIGDSSYGPEGKVIINTSTGVGTLDPAFSTVNAVIFTGATSILPLAKNTRNDFNNDGKSDILWRNDYGSVALWQMNGATVTTGSLTSVPNIDPSWKVAGTGDFDGDGKADILWRNTNGAIAMWAMDGATVKSSTLTSTPSLDNSWTTVGTGDYNGDGKSDILWRNTSGVVAVWAMDGATVKSSVLTSTSSLDSSWKVAGNSDFNGDGKSDILWRNDDGSVALWQMNGAAITASTAVAKLSTDWKIAGTGDFNGDNKADILWRNDDGRVALWQMNGAAITSSSLTSTPSRDSSQTIAGIGDYNGDGKADILWRKDTGATEIWEMNGSTVVSSTLTSVAAESNNWKIAAPII